MLAFCITLTAWTLLLFLDNLPVHDYTANWPTPHIHTPTYAAWNRKCITRPFPCCISRKFILWFDFLCHTKTTDTRFSRTNHIRMPRKENLNASNITRSKENSYQRGKWHLACTSCVLDWFIGLSCYLEAGRLPVPKSTEIHWVVLEAKLVGRWIFMGLVQRMHTIKRTNTFWEE